jgi:ketosteroid isomerase-like protein
VPNTNSSKETLTKFYDAVISRDLARARTYLADDLVFVGLFETYQSPESYLTTLAGLLQVTEKLTPKTITGDGENAAIFMDLKTKSPGPDCSTLVAEWHTVKDGKITHVESAFDGRPFAAMFGGAS